jgi:hypothetical protein
MASQPFLRRTPAVRQETSQSYLGARQVLSCSAPSSSETIRTIESFPFKTKTKLQCNELKEKVAFRPEREGLSWFLSERGWRAAAVGYRLNMGLTVLAVDLKQGLASIRLFVNSATGPLIVRLPGAARLCSRPFSARAGCAFSHCNRPRYPRSSVREVKRLLPLRTAPLDLEPRVDHVRVGIGIARTLSLWIGTRTFPLAKVFCVTRLKAGRSERDLRVVSMRRLSVNRPSLPPLLAKLVQPGTLKVLRRHGWQKLHRCIEQQEPRFGKARYFRRV